MAPARPQRQGLLQLQPADPGHGPTPVPAAVPRAQGPRRTRRQPIGAGLAGQGSQRPPRDSGELKASSGLGPGRGGAKAAWPGIPAPSEAGKSRFRHSAGPAGLRHPAGGGAGYPGRLSLGPRPAAGGSAGASGSRSWFGSGGTRSPGQEPGLGRTEAEPASETWPVLAVAMERSDRCNSCPAGRSGGRGTQWLVHWGGGGSCAR